MVVVRTFESSDKDIVLAFLKASAAISWPGKKFDSRPIISKLKNRPCIKIAELNGRPVGLIWYAIKRTTVGRYGQVRHIYVEPGHRRQGIASRLLAATEAELRSKGIKTIRLTVTKTNRSGIAWARRVGFKPIRTVFEKHI